MPVPLSVIVHVPLASSCASQIEPSGGPSWVSTEPVVSDAASSMHPIPITMLDSGMAWMSWFAELIEQPLLGAIMSSTRAEVISPVSSTEISQIVGAMAPCPFGWFRSSSTRAVRTLTSR